MAPDHRFPVSPLDMELHDDVHHIQEDHEEELQSRPQEQRNSKGLFAQKDLAAQNLAVQGRSV